jgi:hypothetical protein
MKLGAFRIHCGRRSEIYALAQCLVALLLPTALLVAPLARAATVSWIVDADGSWTTATNWSSNPNLPGASDDVVIGQPGFDTITLSKLLGTQAINSMVCDETLQITGGAQLSVAGDSQINGTLALTGEDGTNSLTGGTLSSPGNITIAGTFIWNGRLAGGGKTTLASTCVTMLSDSGLTGAVDNFGTINYTASYDGSLNFNSSTSVLNNLAGATFNVVPVSSIRAIAFTRVAGSAINNAGTLNVTGKSASEPLLSYVPINNSGIINVASGILQSFAGITNVGTINLLAGGNLTEGSGYFLTNTGTLNFQSGTTTFGVNQLVNTSGHVSIQSGSVTLSGAGSNSGNIDVSSGAQLSITGNYQQLAGSSITGAGSITLGNITNFAGSLAVTGPITINNSTTFTADQVFAGPTTITTGSGNVSGSGNLTFSNSFTWNGSTLSGTGKIIVPNSVSGTITSSSVARPMESAGTLTINGNGFGLSNSLTNLATGTLNIFGSSSTFAFGGVFAGGPLVNAGTMNVSVTPPSGTGTLTEAGIFTNSGTLNLNAGIFYLPNGGTNFGTINIYPGSNFATADQRGLQSSCTNGGTINYFAGTIPLGNKYATINNAVGGQINILGGSVTFSGANSGNLNVAAGATLQLAVVQSTTATVTGAGTVILGYIPDFSGALNSTGPIKISGTVVFNTDQNLVGTTTLLEAGTRGPIDGPANIFFAGPLIWSGGIMSGSGTSTLPAGHVLNLSAGATPTLGGRTFINLGTADLAPGATFRGIDGTFKNQQGAVFDSQGDGNLNAIFSPAYHPTFNNAGLFTKSGGTGATTVAWIFNNSGAVDVLSGTLSFTGGGNHTGSFDVASGATLDFAGGVHSLASGTTITGAGAISVSGGTLNVGGDFTNATTLTVGSGATLSFSPGNTLTNTGLIKGAGTIVANMQSSGVVSPGSSPGALHITGNFNELATGLLNMEIAGTTPGTQYDQLFVTGDLTLNGALQVTFIDGFLPAAGQEFDLLQTGGTFTPPASLDFTNAPPGFEYSTTFTGGVFSIDIISVPEPSTFILAAALFSAIGLASRRIAHRRSA